jgi:hypothetical protein
MTLSTTPAARSSAGKASATVSGGGSEAAVAAPFDDLSDLLVDELDDQVEGAIGGR